MSIATKTGDGGTTRLVDGERVSKGIPRVEAYGTIDELIAQIGFARAVCAHGEAGRIARAIQRELFGVSESVATRGGPLKTVASAQIDALTDHVHRIEQEPGILRDWSIPGDHLGGAAFDVARTVCRRAERLVVRLRDEGEAVDASVVIYLNRLADLLWLLGRLVERDAGVHTALREPGASGTRWSKAWP